ncbi:MAG: hypothetical protein ACJA1P_002453, partial [Maribacter sp.]
NGGVFLLVCNRPIAPRYFVCVQKRPPGIGFFHSYESVATII